MLGPATLLQPCHKQFHIFEPCQDLDLCAHFRAILASVSNVDTEYGGVWQGKSGAAEAAVHWRCGVWGRQCPGVRCAELDVAAAC
jgi:hypothetical protein